MRLEVDIISKIHRRMKEELKMNFNNISIEIAQKYLEGIYMED